MKGYIVIVLLCASSVECQQRGLFPAILNLASNAEISTNATCGEPEPEMYCKLVEHVPRHRIRNPQCRTCDSQSANLKERHPITNAIDGTNQWWQSPSIKNGRQFHWVTITLDLRQVFQVAYFIIKAANSPRPGNWILERSLDGVEYQPWQYYAISDTECLSRYNITPRLGPPTYKRDDEVICTSYYSRLVPLEHGEIHTSLINGRPSADDLTPELLEFTSARYIRLRLQRIRTLNADLMTLSYRDPKEVDPIVTRRYYYSIKDISVGGMCICYGHAQSCPWDPVTKKLQCVCEHNTCGESCNECCPGYHQQPWQPGTLSEGNTCEKCNCHNKAEDCYYNQTVADSKMSMNTLGQFVGGGVCLNCSQNTGGVNCETCADSFYRPHKMSPYDEFPCVECLCDPNGSLTPNCIKDDNHANPEKGLLAGQCPCKEGFAGERCDRCAFGYRDFPLCTRCNCSLDGSVNVDPCAACVCKENVMGGDCDLCKQGFYNLQGSNPEGCTECFCFGVSDVCESTLWSTVQVVATDGWLLPAPQTDSIYSPPVIDEDNHITLVNVTGSRTSHFLSSWAAPERFLGNKLASYGGFLSYAVSYDISVENVDKSLPSRFDVIIEGNGRALRQVAPQLLLLTPLKEQRVAVELVPRNFVDLRTGREVDRDELMTILANVGRLLVRAHFNTSSEGPLRLKIVSLDMADPNAATPKHALGVEQCECPWGYSGTSCEDCVSGFYRVGGILFGGNCLQCECNDHASECDANGVCRDCTHNTTGAHCDQCLPGFYGDPTEGTPEDCQRCACPLTVESNNFSPTCHLNGPGEVICDQCQRGYTGAWCDRCANGYYGDPTVAGQGCALCECSGNVDPLQPGHCDPRTGECLMCTGHTAGRHCQRCQDGYFGDAVVAKDCQACGCHGNGSYSTICNVTTGHCECKPNVVGEKCDQCQAGYHGLLTGTGCVACNCSQAGSLSAECDEEGRCGCVPGVIGDKCDRCQHGYYDFQDNGCTACDCAHTHDNCDSETGECICPPHTRGQKCELCEEDHWGHDTVTGCKPCDCSTAGSSLTRCDLLSGQCQCNPEFTGRKCDSCAMGYRAFPECTSCNCNVNGTREEFCDEKLGVCGCEDNCVCKDNVGGPGCDECKRGTFGLASHNPAGCSPCFCFGVSTDCEELGGLVRAEITVGEDLEPLRVVSQSNLTGTLDGVFLHDSDVLLDASLVLSSSLAGPYYWRLPAKFQGNKLLSYGGRLRYAVAFFALDGSGLVNFEPQVLIRGGHLRKLVIYLDMPTPENGVKTTQEVPLIEHKWKYFNSVSDQAVSHSDFMSVLSSVEYVIVKASYGSGMQQSRISNVSLDTAVEAEEGPAGAEQARFVEICECPSGYAGLSCQECAPGYHRKPLSELNPRGPRPLIQPCVPCQCNNHSLACDLDTGKCQGCQHNTVGDHCNLCAPGYYGKVEGSISDCSLCACPHGNKKSFSPSCVLDGQDDYRCDACQPGYEGQHCERCSVGYYGNPMEPDGQCQPCRCSSAGSLHPRCDTLTGQCQCKAGVRGHLCEECEERHVLSGDQCISCNDECTGVLLDSLDDLEKSANSFNFTGVILAPYSLLVSLENTTQEVKALLSPEMSPSYLLSRAEEQLENVSKDIDRLQQKTTQMHADAEDLSQSSERRLTQGEKLLQLIAKVQAATHALEEASRSLNDTLGDELDENNGTQLAEQVLDTLETMRGMELSYWNATASDELSAALAILQQVLKDFHEPQQPARDLAQTIGTVLSERSLQLQDAQALLTTASANNNRTAQLLQTASGNLNHFHDLRGNVSQLSQEATADLDEAQDALADAVNMVEDLVNVTSQLEDARDELELWNPALRKQVDTLVMQMKMKDVLELVYSAEDHAEELSAEARSLQSSLSDVRNVSVNATSAVQANSNIRSDVQEAESRAQDANATAAAAFNLTMLSDGSVSDLGIRVLRRSTEILEESVALNNETVGLMANMSAVKERLNSTRENVSNISRRFAETSAILWSMPNGTGEKVLEAKEQTAAVNASLLSALQRLEDINQRLEESSLAMDRANASVRNANELVNSSEETASAAESKLREAETRAERLFDRLKPLKTLGEHLSRNLSEIKELINQARKQAASIKVAVSAEGDCVRVYRPEVTSSNYNTLTLTVKTSEPDNLLFYMGSSSSVDFMALEMRRGKVAFLWDAGSGHAKLEYPDIQIDNNKWHRIHATRFGKQGSLTVQELKSDENPVVKTTSPGSATVLDVSKSTLVFVGGLGGQIKKSAAVKMTQFKGCMGEASLNGKDIGLWNYIEREGKCGGCFMSPQAEETAFHFDGSGYSVVEKPLRSTATHIVMLFKTFSPNGLLLYLASNGTRDFLSIELVEGKVRLTFELGSGPLTLTTTKAYNTGNWYKIALQRNKRKGYLSVMAAYAPSERETVEGESPGAASDLNRSDRDPIYIGGLPSSRPIRRQVVARSYVGCIKNMEIARTNFDLLRDAYGVRKGCVLQPIRSVTILNEGFLELPPMTLGPQSELMATFSTRNDTGIILAGFNKAGGRKRRQTRQPFLAVMLVHGQLEVHLNVAEGGSVHKVVVRSDAGAFNDGKDHSVILQRNKRTVTVLVDEGHQGTVKLGTASEKISLILSRLYMGGVPPGEGTDLLKTTVSFYGCIKDIAVNTELLDLSSALRYQNVDMDSCLLEERPKRVVLPDDGDLESEPTPNPVQPPAVAPTEQSTLPLVPATCGAADQTGTIPEAHQFGLSRHSHMILNFGHQTVRKSFSIQLSVRTFAPSGLLFYMANPNQVDYATVQLLGGRVFFTCDLGKSSATATLPDPINDGQWHTVKADFGKKSVMVSVDGQASAPAQAKGKASTLDVEGKLYLGGLPQDYMAKNIGNVTHSLAGCVRNVVLNKASLDTQRPASSHATSLCFTEAQDGTFFNGTGYAAFVKEGYKVGSDVAVGLEFRTTEQSGVLLGVSSAKVDAIGLELVNGQVVFHVNNGAGRISATYTPRGAVPLCDGRWHSLLANKNKYGLSLTVDGAMVHTDNPHSQSTSADTNDPVYVGGYPGDVKQNCLTTDAPFRGCMRKFRLIKGHQAEAHDFSSAFLLQGVFPHSCPGRTL
ncbi:laminin subunit alpha-1 [Anguilla anguilla]|uniref:laminin subunit alpha-1 n=1 Tax=Anguilla anguilla TaxID=7936 RepID=UPI0015AF8FB3|nr:laminin subunit alpha-1 [Anguilla anguilla]